MLKLDVHSAFKFLTKGYDFADKKNECENSFTTTNACSFLSKLNSKSVKNLYSIHASLHIIRKGQPTSTSFDNTNHFTNKNSLNSSLFQVTERLCLNSTSKPIPFELKFLSNDDNEAPSCILIGPIESAEKEHLESLYSQARGAYYNGNPIIHDEMYDRIEKRLRFFRSDLVLKYPRCSLKKFSVYADAVFDQSQITSLAGVWTFIFCTGIFLISSPTFFLLQKISQDLQFCFKDEQDFSAYFPHGAALEWLSLYGAISALSMVLGSSVSIAAAKSLAEVLKGNLLALKGSCPHCGEEVYAFVRTDESIRPRHKCECHVCQHPLVFHANIELSPSQSRMKWAYGRIYSVVRTVDLGPIN